ncbi:hypothetical protein RSSM_03352 [Rhodopirellula sallentina SM41]|uniref:Uncharacterized protein n=1 Tax=Rhodopirellula sallentina SM41 TaxID=1263870 RepID=M5U1B1_9BACT|nr:hypothetical protein RSSM_03352 [Rhodopirellula sallentina SM41]
MKQERRPVDQLCKINCHWRASASIQSVDDHLMFCHLYNHCHE